MSQNNKSFQEVSYLIRKLREVYRHVHEHPKALTAWLVGLTIGSFFFVQYFWGVEKVDHFFEKGRDYKLAGYVSLFEQRDSSKNYRVKADLERITKDYGEDGSESVTLLHRAYFPNGGSISFEQFECEIELVRTSYCRDDSLKDWYIELEP